MTKPKLLIVNFPLKKFSLLRIDVIMYQVQNLVAGMVLQLKKTGYNTIQGFYMMDLSESIQGLNIHSGDESKLGILHDVIVDQVNESGRDIR